MSSVRFFVANLPNDVKESDIKAQFADYGTVKHIDLKTPKGSSEADSKVIAFVTIQTDYAQDCVNDLNGQSINGYRIKVSLAKESFLERLKREREEQQEAAEPKNEFQETDNFDLPKSNLAYNEGRNRKVFTEEDLIIGDDDDGLITKKRASTSLRNGKIVIEGVNNEILHTIESVKVKSKKLDEKSSKADLKRKQSLKNLTDQYNQKKNTVQQALQHLNTPLAKKIKFSDDAQPKLFDSGDENDDDDEIRFEEKSAKLTKLQSENEFADKRFKMDAKFLDEADQEADKAAPEEESERAWQIGILEQVVGKQLDSHKPADAKDKKQMLRYDPTSKNQQKYLRADKDATLELKPSKITKVEEKAETEENQNEMVNEMFYTVSDSLANAFKSEQVEGFSLLNMFGQLQNETDRRNDQLKEVAKEKILVSNTDWNTANPFQYDSSDTENEDAADTAEEVVKQENSKASTKKANVILENFFFATQDARFEEGLALFKYDKPLTEDYNKVRDRLNLLIKTQINKKHKLSNGRTKKLNKRKTK